MGQSAASAARVSVEREWTKALCQGDSASLASLNAGALQPVAACSAGMNELLLGIT